MLLDQPTENNLVSVQIFEKFEGFVSSLWLERVTKCVLALEPNSGIQTTIGVVIADDETIRDLNWDHRRLDEVTDVLSFSFTHQGDYYGDDKPQAGWSEDMEFALPPGQSPGLGEVIISYPQAMRQAKGMGRTVDHEVAILLTHGILHLLGYDHTNPEEEATMKFREAKALAQVL